MAMINVNPTRMELLNLRRRQAIAVRGHKLLKDKKDSLIKVLSDILAEKNALQMEVDAGLIEIRGMLTEAIAEKGEKRIAAALMLAPAIEIRRGTRHVMGVLIPVLEVLGEVAPEKGRPYGDLVATPALDSAYDAAIYLRGKVVELESLQRQAEIIEGEIDSLKRRVNALEHILLPQIEGTIKHILAKLDEIARQDLVRLMKAKKTIE